MSRLKTNADEIRLLRRALRTAARHADQSTTRVCMSRETEARVREIALTLSKLAVETFSLEVDAELHISSLVRSRQAGRRRAAA